MKLTQTFQGRESDNGWLILDIKTIDLDGVSQIAINLDDLERIKARSNKEKDLLDQMRNLLSEP
jgi:hypothetical protein